jgi:hypothetical protein
VIVNHGSDQSFTIIPSGNYHVATLTVDGLPVTPVIPAGMSYTFTNVTANHTISATFAKPPYVYGDANGDGTIDISDVVYLISYIFSGGAAPDPEAAGDANCDSSLDISDVVYLIAYIFSGGSEPCKTCK